MSNYLRLGEVRAVRELLLSSRRFKTENERNKRVLEESRQVSELHMYLGFNRMWAWSPVREFVYQLVDNPNVDIIHIWKCGNCGHMSRGNYRVPLIDGNPETQMGRSTFNEEAGNVFWFFLIFFLIFFWFFLLFSLSSLLPTKLDWTHLDSRARRNLPDQQPWRWGGNEARFW